MLVVADGGFVAAVLPAWVALQLATTYVGLRDSGRVGVSPIPLALTLALRHGRLTLMK